ncbi:MAG TPA: amino acid permease [Candidatus Acidoferrum sp.]|nr:amino acid permease [Candidatus Acidoferrum sp.]
MPGDSLKETTIAPGPKPKETVGLVRGLSGWAATAIVVGTMIGTGIFIVPADMARNTGSAALVALVWIVGGALSLFGALAAAELGAALPEAGGTYAYMNRGYGPVWGFLFGWIYAMLGAPTSIATIAAGFMRFVGFLFPTVAAPLSIWHLNVPFVGHSYIFTFTWAQPGAVLAIVAVTFVNSLGVRLGGRVQVVLTIIKIAAIVAVIAVGFFLGHGTMTNFRSASALGTGALGISGFLTAMVGALWAYDGWINLTFVGSEVKNPERNIPLSLIGGVALVCGLYVAMSAACFFVLPFSKIVASRVVAADMVARATGTNAASWLAIVMMVCALGTLNSSILTNARVDYAMARDGRFFRVVRGVNPRFRTPVRALIFQSIIASVLALTGTFEDLYSLYVFTVWIFYGLETYAVIRLRMKEPNLPRPYRTWGYPVVPILFIIGALALTINIWIQRPLPSTMGLGIMLVGLIFYRHWRGQPKPEETAPAG